MTSFAGPMYCLPFHAFYFNVHLFAFEVEEEIYSDEYHLVNSRFKPSDKTKQITVLFRLYFKAIVKPNALQTKLLFYI